MKLPLSKVFEWSLSFWINPRSDYNGQAQGDIGDDFFDCLYSENEDNVLGALGYYSRNPRERVSVGVPIQDWAASHFDWQYIEDFNFEIEDFWKLEINSKNRPTKNVKFYKSIFFMNFHNWA